MSIKTRRGAPNRLTTRRSLCAPDAQGKLDHDRLKLWVRRLRHWTVLGLLPTAAKRNGGAGQHRLYSDRTAYLAAALLRLAGMGLPASVIEVASRDIQSYVRRQTLFAQIGKETIERPHDGKRRCHLITRLKDEAQSIIVGISYTADENTIFLGEAYREFEGAVVLNLTSLFRDVNSCMP
jgi:DNA-binding transcriptional MerR regulator